MVAGTVPKLGWSQFLPYAFMGPPSRFPSVIRCGSQWFFGAWSASQQPLSIAYKELFPIVVAAYLWGPGWASRQVEFLCDNESVVAVLSSGTSRDPDFMVLLRYLALLAVRHSFSFTATSIRGKANPVADALSRFQFQRFRHLAPQAEQSPMTVPPCSAGGVARHVTERCQFFLYQGLAPSTRRVYLSAQRRYFDFCRQDGQLSSDGALLPADEQSLMRFASFLADSLHHSSIKVYLSAVRSLHIDNGLPDPLINCLQLQRLLRGIKRVQGSSTAKCLPITIDLLKVIQRSLDLNSCDHVMLWAACCLGFFGFLRAGEFTTNSSFDPSIHLTVGDLQADSLVDPTCFRVHIKCSKTDPFRVGCDIYVSRGNSLICPVVALGNFLALRGPSPGPLFCYADGRPLTRQQLSSTVQAILYSAGYPGSYSGHSFRIGAATTAAARGIPDHLIKTLGRWSSDAYQLYISTPVGSLTQVSSQLA